jgi:hypothetical protein
MRQFCFVELIDRTQTLIHSLLMKPQLLQITTALTFIFSLTNSAQALPGESVQTVKSWASQHSVLSPLKRGIAELSGMPFYNSQGKLPNGTIEFSMSPDAKDQRSQEETIAFGTAKPFDGFTRQNLGLIAQMFSPEIAEDFKRSRYVARVDYTAHEKRFYQGRTFAYSTTEFKESLGGKQYYHFTVLPLQNLNGAIQGERQCRQQSAGGCE